MGAIYYCFKIWKFVKELSLSMPAYVGICTKELFFMYEKSIFVTFELNFKSLHLGEKFVIIKSILRLYYSPFSYKTLNTPSSINLFCIGCLEAVCGYIMICQLYRVIS